MCVNRMKEILEAIALQEKNQGSRMNERKIQVFITNNYGLSISQSRKILNIIFINEKGICK